MAPDHASEMTLLGQERLMPLHLAPAMNRLGRACEAIVGRELTHETAEFSSATGINTRHPPQEGYA